MSERHASLAALNTQGEYLLSSPDTPQADKDNVRASLGNTSARWNKVGVVIFHVNSDMASLKDWVSQKCLGGGIRILDKHVVLLN